MNRILVYFLGILTGVILTVAVALIINNSSADSGTRFYQVGTYRYKTQDNMWKTIPAIALMPEQ